MSGLSSPIVTLPAGVEIRDQHLIDVVSGARHPLNTVGALILGTVAAGRSLEEAASELATTFGIPMERGRADVRAFTERLVEHRLLELRPGGPAMAAWARGALRHVSRGVVPSPPPYATRRWLIDTRTPLRALVSTGRAMAWSLGCLAATGLLACLLAWAVAGLDPAHSAVVVFGAVLGMWLHEAGHASALRGRPAALLRCGPRWTVWHLRQDVRRARVVAAAGPLTAAATGVAFLVGAQLLDSVISVLVALALAPHALFLLLPNRDGVNLLG